MAVPTALVTFRIRAPPSAFSVQLYGSWDNFAIAYPMQRDPRVSKEHWTGCHTFSNIICDGDPKDIRRPRQGALKMGGTYWYYYKINDEIDFHNTSEPSTTSCPMLPGQIVNVLDLPYVFSGNRSRNPSTSSTSSEKRTMNPQDKFMRPRPAPAKPNGLKLATSPSVTPRDDGINSSTASTPYSNVTVKDALGAGRFLGLGLVKKASVDATSPALSNGRSGGLRTAFRVRSARSQSPEGHGSFVDSENAYTRRAASAERSYRVPERTRAPQRALLLRSTSDDTIPTSSFSKSRQLRSISRENSGVRVPTMLGDLSGDRALHSVSQAPPLSALKEVSSNQNTPISAAHTNIEDADTSGLDLEKRLPTLPNTPSSAYPVSMIEDSPQRVQTLDLEGLESHFSTTTIDSEPSLDSVIGNFQVDHFSAWTRTGTLESRTFGCNSHDVESSPTTFSPCDTPVSDCTENFMRLAPAFSFSSLSSNAATTPSTPQTQAAPSDEFPTVENASNVLGNGPQKMQQYSLNDIEFTSATTLKTQRPKLVNDHSANLDETFRETTASRDAIIHSESMQKLLDELSYLSDIIRR